MRTKLKLTPHAVVRMNQRGIRLKDVHLIYDHGEWMDDEVLFVTDKAKNAVIKGRKKAIKFLEGEKPQGWQSEIECLQKEIQRLDKLGGRMVVVNFDRGELLIITSYKRKNNGKEILRHARKSGFWH